MLPIFLVIPTKLIPQTKKAAGNVFGGGGSVLRLPYQIFLAVVNVLSVLFLVWKGPWVKVMEFVLRRLGEFNW